MAWSWVDLDVKRLEPWFQLSKQEGASSTDSLLLQYPFDFLPFIPITAFRRKHWSVFISGTIMLMIFWIVTPLQSAIFNTGTVTQTIRTDLGTSANLTPIKSQTSNLNTNFLNTAYGISWLGQKLPPFTTYDFTLLPFRPVENTVGVLPSETWSMNTTIYNTNLTCTPAIVKLEESFSYSFDNGRGCMVSDIGLPDTSGVELPQPNGSTKNADYMMLYIGYYDDARIDYALQNPNCSAENSNNFLALWASASSRTAHGVYSNLTAVFCETSYYSRAAYVTVNASDSSVAAMTVTGNFSTLSKDVFNTSLFEYISGVGASPTGERSNVEDQTVLEQFPRLNKYNLTWPVTNMLGFAIGLKSVSMDELAQPAALQQIFQRAHQLLFGAAFNALTVPTGSASLENIQSGVRQSKPVAIVMVRTVAIVVEVTLGIIVVMTICLWYYTKRRLSCMTCDPASMAEIISVVRNDSSLLRTLDCGGSPNSEELASAISKCTFALKADMLSKTSSLDLVSNSEQQKLLSKDLSHKDSISSTASETFTPVWPLELRLSFGIPLSFLILLVLAGITTLKIWSSKHDGISLPSNNTIVLSIIENYLPTAFATLLEPAWVLLNRILCLLQPFEELRKGNAKPSASIQIKYYSLPPQLVVWKALKSRHFLLAAVCVIAISTNVLAVALSGLLNEGSTTSVVPTNTSSSLLPEFDGIQITSATLVGATISYSDHFYVTLSNLTGNTTLPAWIDQSYYYLPFDIEEPANSINPNSKSQIQSYKGLSTGFGATVDCVELVPGRSKNGVQFKSNANGLNAILSTTHLLENGTEITCFPLQGNPSSNISTGYTATLPSGALAMEFMQSMYPAPGVDDGGFCASLMVAGWVRGKTDSLSQNLTSLDGNVTSLFVSCTPKLQAAEFEVLVDPAGHVLNSTLVGNFSRTIQQYFSPNTNESSLLGQSTSLIAPGELVGDSVWHNDSFTSDWMNSLLGIMLDTGRLVDPSAPIPESKDVIPALEKLYTRLFALLLGLNTHVFTPATKDSPPVQAFAIIHLSRLFVSSLSFKVSVIILSLHFIVSVLYYTNRPKRFLPRMPTSIASIIAYVSASRALDDFAAGADGNKEEQRYGYGRFIGTDGKTHVGIERQRYVVPLETRNPEVKRRRLWRIGRAKDDEKQPKTWI
ncbi:hypothetical protein B7463_g1109, partial [Scytalidium lignicola]